MSHKILLVDDHAIVREGLKSLLEDEDDIEVVGEAKNGREALEFVRKVHPDLVIMDIAMPELNGIEAAKRITAEFAPTKVIILSVHNTRKYIAESFKAGASAYISKECMFNELVQAIRVVLTGKNYISPAIASVLINDYVDHSSVDTDSELSMLKDREKEILQMFAEGHSAKEIAAVLNVSVKTIDAMRRNIMEKLNIHSMAELTKYAITEGLTSLEF